MAGSPTRPTTTKAIDNTEGRGKKDAVVVVKKKKKKEVVVVLFTAHGRVSNAAQEQSHPKNHKECERKTKTQKFFYFSPF